MSVELIQSPSKTIQQDIPNVSRWSAAWHPIVWKFLRKDLVITDIDDSGNSPASVNIKALGDFTSELEVGDTIYVNSDNGNQEGMFEILSFSYDGGSGKTTIEYDNEPSSSMTISGYANLIDGRTFYMIEVAIYDYQQGVSVLLTDEYAQFRPDTKGNIKAKLETWLRSVINPKSTFDYIARSQGAEHIGHRYDIQIREYWKESGYTEFESYDELNNHYVMCAVKQIGDLYGQNMGEYVMFPPDVSGSPQIEHAKGKFLSVFPKPTYFVGYPFDLSFIYDKSISDEPVRLSIVEEQKDVNNAIQSTTDDMIDEISEQVNRITVKPVFTGDAYASNIKSLNFYLKAKQLSGGSDPSAIVWNVKNTGSDSGIQIVDLTSSKTIAFTTWDTDITTTLNRLKTSCNTNTPNGTPFNLAYPFDNSAGYVIGTIVSTGGGAYDVPLSAPINSGGNYNGTNITYLVDAGVWTILPSQSQSYSGGVDGTYSDANGLTTAIVSEIKQIKVDNTCYDSPVYLRWINPVGGYEYWLFNRNQIISGEISNEQTYEKYIEDLEDDEERAIVMSKDSQDRITVGAENIDSNDMIGIRNLLSSISVSMLVINDSIVQSFYGQQTNFTWKSVRVMQGTFEILQTIENKSKIELTLLPPQRYNQKQ